MSYRLATFNAVDNGDVDYHAKYLKYKQKYLSLCGGSTNKQKKKASKKKGDDSSRKNAIARIIENKISRAKQKRFTDNQQAEKSRQYDLKQAALEQATKEEKLLNDIIKKGESFLFLEDAEIKTYVDNVFRKTWPKYTSILTKEYPGSDDNILAELTEWSTNFASEHTKLSKTPTFTTDWFDIAKPLLEKHFVTNYTELMTTADKADTAYKANKIKSINNFKTLCDEAVIQSNEKETTRREQEAAKDDDDDDDDDDYDDDDDDFDHDAFFRNQKIYGTRM